MPGLFGYFCKNTNKIETNTLIRKMRERLDHFQFYKSILWDNGKAGLGITTVSDDSDTFLQPSNNIENCIALFGDIFKINNVDISECNKHTLSEIHSAYQKSNHRFQQNLDGDFNIAIFDTVKKTLILCNDRFGYKHLYIYEDSDIVLFSPEIKAFLAYPKFNKTIDEQGIADFFNFGYNFGDRTLLKYVSLLPPASFFTVNSRTSKLQTYWHPYYTNQYKKSSLPELIPLAKRLFEQSIERRTKNLENLLIPLSGGLDSRLITATCIKAGKNVTNVTYGNKHCLEYKIADQVCEKLGITKSIALQIQPDWLDRNFDLTNQLNEGLHSALPLCHLHGFAQSIGLNYDCYMNGIYGGHISFGPGYFNNSDLRLDFEGTETINYFLSKLEGERFPLLLEKCCTSRCNNIVYSFREKTIKEEWDRTEKASDKFYFRKDYLFLYNRMRRVMNVIDQNKFYYNNQHPFQGYQLFDLYLSLSPELMIDQYLYKELIKQVYPSMAKIPWWTTGVDLYSTPSASVQRCRQIKRNILWYITRLTNGYVNIDNSDNYMQYDNHLRRMKNVQKKIRNILLSDRCICRGYFSSEGITNLLNWQKKGGSSFEEISRLVAFELWARNFLD